MEQRVGHALASPTPRAVPVLGPIIAGMNRPADGTLPDQWRSRAFTNL